MFTSNQLLYIVCPSVGVFPVNAIKGAGIELLELLMLLLVLLLALLIELLLLILLLVLLLAILLLILEDVLRLE
jgi:hypothetical protein